MEYIEYIKNLRQAMRTVASIVPEIETLARNKALLEKDDELKIVTMPDMEFYMLERKYEQVEEKIFRFNPEEEYGQVHTMWPEDMRGDER